MSTNMRREAQKEKLIVFMIGRKNNNSLTSLARKLLGSAEVVIRSDNYTTMACSSVYCAGYVL